MIPAQTILAPDLAFLPRLFITILLIWLTGTVLAYMNKLLALSRHVFTHPRHRGGHERTAVHHIRGHWPG
jgi:hypothetical protein